MQYGFRKARSTVDAINLVLKTARNAIQGKGVARKYCAIVTLDIKKAFNSAGWKHIVSRMKRINIPNYLIKITMDYFTNRTLWYETDNGLESHSITAGVPQGSVLGPLLWNIMYDDIFRLQVPEEVDIVGFADDVAIIVQARHLQDVELYANEAIHTISLWLKSVNLNLADHKTESVLISGKRKRETITLQVGNAIITSSQAIKYLGVMIDDRLNFKIHMDYACRKATGVTNALARMMPNIGGPRYSRRLLLTSVTNSILLYGAPAWGKMTKTSTIKNIMSLFRRSCLRVCCGYRTISIEAASVIAGMVPIDMAVSEQTDIYHALCEDSSADRRAIKFTEREKSIQRWQRRWDNAPKGRWTYRLIPNISSWMSRKHGEINYNLTQFLSGHGGYRSYLHRFGLDDSPRCPECLDEDETAEHVVFNCPRFLNQRREVEQYVGENLVAENIVSVMLQSESNWEAVKRFIEFVNHSLNVSEKIRKAELARSTR